jgi:hypothetical protein
VASKANITGNFKSSLNKYRRLEIDAATGTICLYNMGLGPTGNQEYKAYELRYSDNTGHVELLIQYLHPEMGLRTARFSPYVIKVDSLPTNPSSLEQGQLWNDGGTVKIK